MGDAAFEDMELEGGEKVFVDGRESVYAPTLSFIANSRLLDSNSASGPRALQRAPTIDAIQLRPRQLSASAQPRVP